MDRPEDRARTADGAGTTGAAALRFSVISPYYNEAEILAASVRRLAARLRDIPGSWELVLVNDGSTDTSPKIADGLAREFPEVRLAGYPQNTGRGHALRAGLDSARGNILVTLESDLSWGENIVGDLLGAMERWPDADLVVASPHLSGGGFRDVPALRRMLSREANRVIRLLAPGAPTMSTGMTRAYRAESVRRLSLREDKKAFHLEVILKALQAGWTIREIPAVLAWNPEGLGGVRGNRTGYIALLRASFSHLALLLRERPRHGPRTPVKGNHAAGGPRE
jgi:dolichol-phosphate mannosyltransferase